MHRFGHPTPQFLKRDVPYTGLHPDEICPRRYIRHDFPSNLTKATPASIPLRRFAHPAGHGVSDLAGLVGRQRRHVVYPDRTGPGTSSRAPEGDKCRPASHSAEWGCSHGLIGVRQTGETGRAVGQGVARPVIRQTGVRDRAAAGPSRPLDRRGSTSGAGSRAYGLASGCSVGRCASSRSLLRCWRGVRTCRGCAAGLGASHDCRANDTSPGNWPRGRGKPGVARDDFYCTEEWGKFSSGLGGGNAAPARPAELGIFPQTT
jgi:hypothetical protein